MLEIILKEIEEANDLEKLEEVKKEYIGKKGKISLEMRNLKNLDPEERKTKGQELGAMKKIVDSKIIEKSDNLHIIETNKQLEKEIVDITSIGKTLHRGHFDKVQMVRREIENILQGLSFHISYTDEIINNTEEENENTIFLEEKSLRTYLSTGLENKEDTTKKAIIGKVYNRNPKNSSQDTTIWKAEGIISDQEITLANILDIIKQISSELLGENTELRFRPTNLPYATGGIAGDVACKSCKQKGCEICSNKGWIELFQAGTLEEPKTNSQTESQTESNNSARNSSTTEKTNNTFIFSINITKLTMTKYTIKDIKLFHSGDLRFTKS